MMALMSVAAAVASKPAQAQASGQAVVSEARSWLGTPYVYGGTTRAGVDCSGLTQGVLRSVGVQIPRTSGAQFYAGSPSWYNGANAGDLVFSDFGYGFASHVGIATGDGQMINSPYPGTVTRYDPIWWNNVNGVKSFI